jgi:hypothetical protein
MSSTVSVFAGNIVMHNQCLHLTACGTLAKDWRAGSHDAGEAWR